MAKGLAKVSLLVLAVSLVGFFAVNSVQPTFAVDTPYCTTTGTYSVCTDQADYSPEQTVTIYGSGFLSNAAVTINVTRPDGLANPPAWTVTSDESGSFTTTYLLDGITGEYKIEVLDLENNVLASHEFTDAAGMIIVTKVVSGGSASASSFTITGSGDCFSSGPVSLPGSSTGTTYTCANSGNSKSYTITETPISGYSASYSSGCTGVINKDETKSCTVTNSYNPPTQLCGNGIIEGTETCDDGNTANGDCCSSTCQYESASTVCRASAGACDVAETCTGSSAPCPADSKSTAQCRASAGVCDIAESCDGISNNCPADAFQSSSTLCRASAGVCDVVEQCTGSSAACPTDGFVTAGTVCNAASCSGTTSNLADTCNGLDVSCHDGGTQLCNPYICSAGNGLCLTSCTTNADCVATYFCDLGTCTLDTTPPITNIALNPTNPNGNNNWYTTNVHVTVSATDNLGGSGVAETRCVLDPVSPPATFDDMSAGCTYGGAGADVTTEGQHIIYAASKDNLNNKETPVKSTSFKIDKTGPSATLAVTAGTLGTNGWYTSDVTVHTSGSDTISDNVICTADQFQITETTGHVFNGQCTNDAGLSTGATPLTIKLDKTGPSATLAVTVGTLGSNGWYTSDVTVSTTGTDSISSPVTCSDDQYQTSETTGTDFNGHCTNDAGLTTNAAPLTVKLDKTGPSATLSVTAGTLGLNGWYTSDVTVSASGTDSISDSVTCTIDQYQNTETAGQIFNGACTNGAGLKTDAAPLTVKLDKTGPSAALAVTAGTLGLNGWYTSDVTIHASGTDAISDSVTCTDDQHQTTETTGAVFNGACTNDAGLTTHATPITIKLDKTGPSAALAVTTGTLGSNDWYTSDVTVSTSGSDAISDSVTCTPAQHQTTETTGQIFNGQCTNGAGLTTDASPLTIKLDKTAPTTSDDSSSTIQVPSYIVTITPADATSGVTATYWCKDTDGICTPTTDGGTSPFTVTFTASNRGVNHLRYYSTDAAGNSQTIQDKTININQLPTFTSATDDATIIKGGSTVTITTVASDADAGQTLKLFVCKSTTGVSSSGCGVGNGYCSDTTDSSNPTCNFVSETDDTTHNWYAYIFDSLDEAATSNPKSGSYTTDSTPPARSNGLPSGNINTGTPTLSLTTNELATCKYSTTAGTSYDSMTDTFSTTGGTSHSQLLSLSDGSYTYYVRCVDSVGNKNTDDYSISFVVDTAKPDTSDDYGIKNGVWQSSDQTITLTPHDPSPSSGLDWTKYCTDTTNTCDPTAGTAYTTPVTISTEGTTYFRYASKDLAGNVQDTVSRTVKIDKTAPSGGSITYTDGYYTTASVPITYTLGTDSESGLNTASGKIQRASATLSGGVCGSFGSFTDLVTEFDGSYTDTSVASGNCYKYQYVIADNVGNSATYTSDNIAKVDTDAPTTSDDASTTWRSTDAIVALTPSDTGGSGVANTYYCIYNSGDAACTSYSTGTSASVTCAADSVCQKIVRYYSTDNAGNIETAHDSAVVQIDKTKPVTTLTIGTPKSGSDPTYVSTGTEFTLAATDSGSGVDYIEYKFNNSGWTKHYGNSVDFVAPGLGFYTLYYHAVDKLGNAEAVNPEDIIVGATKLTYTGDTFGQYSDLVTVSATLVDKATPDLPLEGKTITFQIGTQSVSDVTDSSGVATATITLTQPYGSYTVDSSFAGDDDYQLSSDSDSFTINKENVAIEYTGDLNVITAGPTINTAPVRLAAHLVQDADGFLGDLTLAKVTFVLTPLDGSYKIIVPNVPVNAAGDALATKIVPVGDYKIEVKISCGNLYWTQNPYGDGSLHIEAGGLDQRVTGGGWIPDALSANGKDNFGFTVYYNKNGAPKGNFLFMFRGTDGYDYQLKSNSWAKGGLSFTSTNTAFFTGKATLSKIDRVTGAVVSSDGSYTFVVNIQDLDFNVKPVKTPDTFSITIFDSSNNIWKQIGTSASPIKLGGGNIVVHSK